VFFHKLVPAYMTTRRHIPEDNMNKHCGEGLKNYKCKQHFCSNTRRKFVGRGSRHTLENNIGTASENLSVIIHIVMAKRKTFSSRVPFFTKCPGF
jgi:hypothetical protein